MQKGFAAPFVLLGILIIGGLIGAYFVFGKNAQKANLKEPFKNSTVITVINDNLLNTYTNKTLSFQFQYPAKDLTVKEDTEQDYFKRGGGDFRKNFKGYVSYEPGQFLGAVVVLDKSNSFDLNPFTIWIFDNPNNLDIDQWYKMYWYYPFVWGDFTYTGKVELSPKKESTISGQIAKSGIIDYQPGKPKFVYLSNNGKMYLIRLINSGGKMADQILQSFKLSDSRISQIEKQKIDEWIIKNDLNQYGDSKNIAYAGGTPLFNEVTGKGMDKYDYILQKYPDRPWDK